MLRRQKAFTLIELMVVVSIIALLAMMLVPALQRALEMTRRANCLANLKGAGTSLAIYTNDMGAYPMMPGITWDTTEDGKNYQTAPYDATTGASLPIARSVTSLMFLLVRGSYTPPKLYCCPSDHATPDDATTTTAGVLNWDFSNGQGNAGAGTIGSKRNVSYSFQCPIFGAGTPEVDGNGIDSSADPAVVVMADRTPAKVGGATTGVDFTGWTAAVSTGGATGIQPFNSQNHTSGEVMNVLYFDSHASSVRNPNCGATQSNNTTSGGLDCIFTTATAGATVTADGVDFAGTLAYKNHIGKRDTYLVGGEGL